MCFSAKASIISFCVGMIGAIFCISLGTITDKIVGYFFAFVSCMQGIDYLLWSHQICDDYNRTFSIFGMILNNLQPFVLGLVILLINTKTPNKNWIIGLMILYLCIIIPYSMQYDTPIKQCTIKDEKSKHLNWNWTYMNYTTVVYTILLLYFCVFSLLGFPKLIYGIYFSIFAVISYITSAYFYTISYAGSLWCYYSVFFPIIYYLCRTNPWIIKMGHFNYPRVGYQ
jgi:hypothetical protein